MKRLTHPGRTPRERVVQRVVPCLTLCRYNCHVVPDYMVENHIVSLKEG